MLVRIMFLLCLLTAPYCFSQQADESYLGSWNGFGYLESDAREGCMSRLVIEKISGQPDSVRCIFSSIPLRSKNFLFPYLTSYTFNAAVKSLGTSKNLKNTLVLQGLSDKIYLVEDDQQVKLYMKEHYIGPGFILDLDYLYTRSAAGQVPDHFYKKIYHCVDDQYVPGLRKLYDDPSVNMKGLSDGLREKKVKQYSDQLNVDCVLQNIDLTKINYSYLKALNLLVLEIRGLSPIYLILDPVQAAKIIASPKAVLEFKKFDQNYDYQTDMVEIISVAKAEITFETLGLIINYPQPEFLTLSTLPHYAAYVRKEPKKLPGNR